MVQHPKQTQYRDVLSSHFDKHRSIEVQAGISYVIPTYETPDKVSFENRHILAEEQYVHKLTVTMTVSL